MLTTEDDTAPKKRTFPLFAYVLVAGGFISQILRFIGQRSFSIALPDVQATLGVSTAEVGLIASFYGAVSALGAILWGPVSDKIGPRLAMTLSGLTFSAGAILFGFFGGNDLVIAVATWSIAGLGSAGLYMATVPKLVSAWFVPEKRGHAMRLITPGGAVASLFIGIIMPIGTVNFGWGPTFVIIGIAGLVCSAFFFFLIRDDPYEKNLVPVGSLAGTRPAPAIKDDKKAQKGAILAAMKLGIVWRIGIMYIFYQLFWQANSTFYVANIRGIGFSPAESGLAVTICAIAAILAMQVWGPLSDKIGRKNTLLVSFAGVGVMSGVLFFVSQSNPNIIVLYILLAVMNCFISTAPVVLAMFSDYFPEEINSTANGIVSTLSAIGYYFAPWIGGMAIDMTGNSHSFYLIILASVGVTFLLTVILPKTKHEQDKATTKSAR